MRQKEIIIFCQAPADVPFLLSIYENQKKDFLISIFVINVEAVYLFIKQLNLEVNRLIFIPYRLFSFTRIDLICIEKKRIEFLYEKYFSLTNLSQIYFFSRFGDWLTSYFLHRLSKNSNNTLYYACHYDDNINYSKKKKKNLKTSFILHLLYFITGVKFKADVIEKIPEFPVNKYLIDKIKVNYDLCFQKKYLYHPIDINTKKACILFFISPCFVDLFNEKTYNKLLIDIIDRCQLLGYDVVLKGHPRLGIPNEVKKSYLEIPSYIPGEFIDISMFSFCIGLDTSAICYFAKNKLLPTYSIMNLFDILDFSLLQIQIDYLNSLSNGLVLICKDRNEFIQILSDNLKHN